MYVNTDLRRYNNSRAVANNLAKTPAKARGVSTSQNAGQAPESKIPAVKQLSAVRVINSNAPGPAERANKGLPRKTTRAVSQRRILPFKTREEDDDTVKKWKNPVAKFVNYLNDQVNQARELALNWQALNHDDGYISTWINAANAFFKQPNITPKFIHARFGYAIETLACKNLPGGFDGLTVHKQFSSGSTRPDIVLEEKNQDGQVAWIDITAEESEGHIRGKDGGGWKTRPFVFEVLYNSLNLKEILGGGSPVMKEVGNYFANKAQISEEEKEKQRIRARNVLIELREKKNWQTGIITGSEKMEETKEHVEKELGIDLGYSWKKNLKGLLSWVEITDGPYGFNTYYGGQDSNNAKTWIDEAATPYIDKGHKSVNLEEKKETNSVLDMDERYEDIIFVKDYYKGKFQSEEHFTLAGIAVRVAAPVYLELEDAYQNLKNHQTGVGDLSEFADEVELQLKDAPQEANVLELNTWVNDANKLIKLEPAMIRAYKALSNIMAIEDYFGFSNDYRAIALLERIKNLENFPSKRDALDLDIWADEVGEIPAYANCLKDTIEMQQKFLKYLHKKYKTPNHLFLRTKEENTILVSLGSDPQNYNAVNNATRYLNNNPLLGIN